MPRHLTARAITLFGACAIASSALTKTPDLVTAVPPATYTAPTIEKAVTTQRPLVDGPRRTISLAAPTDAERKALVSGNAKREPNAKTSARAIGLGRELGALDRNVQLAELDWIALPDGGKAARIDVTSSGAAAVRLAITMRSTDPDITLRFAGSADPTRIFGPVPANQVADTAAREGVFWTPVLEGDTGTIELYAPAGASIGSVALGIPRLSHLLVAGSALRDINTKRVADIGASGSCEVDVVCVATPASSQTAKSVAQLLFTNESGTTELCTGTLLNDGTGTFTPYLYTANHCIDSQAAASTLNTYWFFEALTCGSKDLPPYVFKSGGASLLGRSIDYDWSLVRLRDTPPDGAQFSAWRAEVVPAGTPAGTAHHPEGDLKKWSQGATLGYFTYSDGSTFIQMQYNLGSTEPGSSGAGLFTVSPNGGFFELRGGLYGGEAACGNPTGTDRYSRMDRALPLLRQYLTPNTANPNAEVVVVEFYNRTLDTYFISSNPAEINDLDTGVHPGWERTGLRFLAYGDPALAPAGATPVCRFYLDPQFGDSHFYSGSPTECAQTLAKFGNSWTYESPAVFYTVLPDQTTGACPAGMNPVYRFFNSARTNHRYTTEEDLRQELAATPGWIPEGYGPKSVIMCSPAT